MLNHELHPLFSHHEKLLTCSLCFKHLKKKVKPFLEHRLNKAAALGHWDGEIKPPVGHSRETAPPDCSICTELLRRS
jgi:hypothetical protein